MRYRLMASFQGAPYQAGIGPSDEEVTLFAACPPPEELGFRSSSGHWRKRVSVEEIDALWESRPIGRYQGERCMVLDDLGDRMHIAYLGRDLYMARRLGFWEVDRGVFEVVVPRQDITDLREERGEYELAVLDPVGGSVGGSWDGGHRETWASNPRDYGSAPDTGPLRSPVAGPPRGLVDTGPSWATDARGPQGPGGWDDGEWDMRDDQAQDPRDTGTWAAAGDLDPRDAPESRDPFPRGRGGWRARDTGGWEAPDTGAWDAREVAERAAREAADRRAVPAPRSTGGWSAREIADAAAREAAADRETAAALAPRNTDGWSTRDVASGPGRDKREDGGWGTREDPGWDARGNGGWDVPAQSNGGWDVPAQSNGVWGTREDAGGWDACEAATAGQQEADRWDPSDTVAWSPVNSGEWDPPSATRWSSRSVGPAHARPPAEPDTRPVAEWEPNEVVRPSDYQHEAVRPPKHQRTPDAAAVWHGSPTPGDTGRWNPPAPMDGRGNPPRLAIASGPAAAVPATAVDPGAAHGLEPVTARSAYHQPSLARETGAVAGANGAAVGRHVSRRSSGKTRVTSQTVFSQLMELASIPQSAYAVDAEVDGAMCLIRARGGYEVFSSADQTRHEVRFFEDEEAAYFYLFGILAAEAVRSGQLGPVTAPPGHRGTSAEPGYPSGLQ
jgi:hypothetical protein